MVKKVLTISSTTLISLSNVAYAATNSNAGWELVDMARKGLFWIGLFSIFYGLYLMLLKRDDSGKKIIVTSFLVYLASYLLPEIFIYIDKVFK